MEYFPLFYTIFTHEEESHSNSERVEVVIRACHPGGRRVLGQPGWHSEHLSSKPKKKKIKAWLVELGQNGIIMENG